MMRQQAVACLLAFALLGNIASAARQDVATLQATIAMEESVSLEELSAKIDFLMKENAELKKEVAKLRQGVTDRTHSYEEASDTNRRAISFNDTFHSSTSGCPFGNASGIGEVTIGISYNRMNTVTHAIADMFNSDKDAWYTRFVSHLVRESFLADVAGASFDKVSDKIISEAGPLLVEGLLSQHLTIVPTGSAKQDPNTGAPDKTGMILMQFQVCGPSPEQKECFRSCNIFGTTKEEHYLKRLRGWAKDFGNWLFDALEPLGLKGVVGGQILQGMVDAMPGQLMAGLQAAKVGNPNIVVWPEGFDWTVMRNGKKVPRKQEMFAELATAEQAETEGPQTPCPKPGRTC